MLLSKKNLPEITGRDAVSLPPPNIFRLPERAIQFGTGVFLRGLIDYYIDNANRKNIFNGRVVVVKSTGAGEIESFARQDGLYTLLMRSVSQGTEVSRTVICSAISRVLTAKNDWEAILACAADANIRIIISNTTEAGITLEQTDKVQGKPPSSFPGKLLAFLERRYIHFNGSAESGMVILPTELIVDNGDTLQKIANELAILNGMDNKFINWMNHACDFCNTLVDRIVPGKLPEKEQLEMEKKLGYRDELMIMSETFGLWAIEAASENTRRILSFSEANDGIHLVENIYSFRELKLRLLNGSHNLSCALGFIAGFETVKEAMADNLFGQYMERLILGEIAPAILNDHITAEQAKQFGTEVLERYRNPFIAFSWLDICVQDTAKIKIRAVPIIQQHIKKSGFVPDGIAMGFAAYLLFMKSEKTAEGGFVGTCHNRTYSIQDDFASLLHDKWKEYTGESLVRSVLKDKRLWDTDLSGLTAFPERVTYYLDLLMNKGFAEAMQKSLQDQSVKPADKLK